MTRIRWLTAIVLPLLLVGAGSTGPQAPEPTRRVRFTTREGSWLAFDVSRDGRWIVMDLLGQLWRLPIEGGTARALTDVVRDTAEFLDPSFSPDGRTVMAHGEFRGQLGVFAVPVAGGTASSVAPDATINFGLAILSPAWAASGRRMVRSRLDTVLALFEREVARSAERRIEVRGMDPVPLEGPAYSADGSEVFVHTRPANSDFFPPAGRIWRVPMAGGTARPFTPAGLPVRAAAPSPDGRWVAYLAFDSTSRAQVWIQGVQDSVGVRLTSDPDVTPTRVRWMPASDAVVYSESGRLWRLDVRTRVRREIPFSATVEFPRRKPPLPPIRFPRPGERVQARSWAGVTVAPDGRAIAFIALNKLWILPTDRPAEPRALIELPPSATDPAWSPDGRHIAWHAGPLYEETLYVTETATGRSRTAYPLPGPSARGAWSPDGRHLLFTHVNTDSTGRQSVRLRVAPVDSAITSVEGTRDLGPLGALGSEARPQWSPRGDAVLVVDRPTNPRNRNATLRFLNGSPPRPVRGLPVNASWVRWLPGDTLVFQQDLQTWKAPLDVASATVGDPQRLMDDPVLQLETSPAGDMAFLGEQGYRFRTRTGEVRTLGWPLQYTVPTPSPLLVRNVRIVDGTGRPASAPSDILVERGRIARIAPSGRMAAPSGARVVDGNGRTAIPGLIDLHGHFGTAAAHRGLLYYGVTTVRSAGPSLAPDNVHAGTWLGPRVSESFPRFLTGGSADASPGYIDRALRLGDAMGVGQFKIRTFSAWAAHVRTIAGAHARGIRVMSHCGFPLATVAAGIDSKEHVGWQCSVHDAGTWYDDLIQLYVRSGVPIVATHALFTNTHRLRGTPEPPPTEVAGLFGPVELSQVSASLNYLSRITPANSADLRHQADQIRRLHRAGAVIGVGTDFERPDGVQYELEALVDASLSPLEAISSATSVAARILGAEGEVGRIAPGLIADIVLLDADPTRDIRNVRKVSAVIQGGRVVDRQALVAPGWNSVVVSR